MATRSSLLGARAVRGGIQLTPGDRLPAKLARHVELLRSHGPTRTTIIETIGGDVQRDMPRTAPVEDMLGLRDDEVYLAHLSGRYGRAIDVTPERVAEWRPFAEALPEAVARASELRFPELLVPAWLEIRFSGAPFVPDLLPADLRVLASWALELMLRQPPPFTLRTCPTCGLLWLAEAGDESEFCRRPAPGRRVDCRTAAREDRKDAGYRREYRRLRDRYKRGRLSEEAWKEWRASNRPGKEGETWQRLDEDAAPRELAGNGVQ